MKSETYENLSRKKFMKFFISFSYRDIESNDIMFLNFYAVDFIEGI